MARIIVESDVLFAIAEDVAANCTALGYVDSEDVDDIMDFYVPQLQAAADALCGIVRNAEKVAVK